MRVYTKEEIAQTLEECGYPEVARVVRESPYKEFGYESWVTFTPQQSLDDLLYASVDKDELILSDNEEAARAAFAKEMRGSYDLGIERDVKFRHIPADLAQS